MYYGNDQQENIIDCRTSKPIFKKEYGSECKSFINTNLNNKANFIYAKCQTSEKLFVVNRNEVKLIANLDIGLNSFELTLFYNKNRDELKFSIKTQEIVIFNLKLCLQAINLIFEHFEDWKDSGRTIISKDQIVIERQKEGSIFRMAMGKNRFGDSFKELALFVVKELKIYIDITNKTFNELSNCNLQVQDEIEYEQKFGGFIVPIIKGPQGIFGQKEMIPTHYFMIIVGKPGSGKTSFIKAILNQDLSERYNGIILMSPSYQATYLEKGYGIYLDVDRYPRTFKFFPTVNIPEISKIIIRENLRWEKIEDLQGLRITINTGVQLENRVLEYIKNAELQLNSNPKLLEDEIVEEQPEDEDDKKKSKPKEKLVTPRMIYTLAISESMARSGRPISSDLNDPNYFNLLLIFDDVITEINADPEKKKFISDMVKNRRNKIKFGMISMIMAVQYYVNIQKDVRTQATIICVLGPNKEDWTSISDDKKGLLDRKQLMRMAAMYQKKVGDYFAFNFETSIFYHAYNNSQLILPNAQDIQRQENREINIERRPVMNIEDQELELYD